MQQRSWRLCAVNVRNCDTFQAGEQRTRDVRLVGQSSVARRRPPRRRRKSEPDGRGSVTARTVGR